MHVSMLAALATPSVGSIWFLTGVLFVLVLAGAALAAVAARRIFHRGGQSADDLGAHKPHS
jgi:hypothetical protein